MVLAPWRSGYAAVCKTAYTGSNPVGASKNTPAKVGVFLEAAVRRENRRFGGRGTERKSVLARFFSEYRREEVSRQRNRYPVGAVWTVSLKLCMDLR